MQRKVRKTNLLSISKDSRDFSKLPFPSQFLQRSNTQVPNPRNEVDKKCICSTLTNESIVSKLMNNSFLHPEIITFQTQNKDLTQ